MTLKRLAMDSNNGRIPFYDIAEEFLNRFNFFGISRLDDIQMTPFA